MLDTTTVKLRIRLRVMSHAATLGFEDSSFTKPRTTSSLSSSGGRSMAGPSAPRPLATSVAAEAGVAAGALGGAATWRLRNTRYPVVATATTSTTAPAIVSQLYELSAGTGRMMGVSSCDGCSKSKSSNFMKAPRAVRDDVRSDSARVETVRWGQMSRAD